MLSLNDITLYNFRSHKEFECSFNDGVNAIVGVNGSGKSSLLEAVSWALFGSKGVTGTNDSLTRRGAKTPARVVLHFTVDGKGYVVDRTVGAATLSMSGIEIAAGTQKVDDAILAILGVTAEQFLSTYYARQKKLEWMSGRSSSDKSNLLNLMLGLSVFKESINEQSKEISALKRSIATHISAQDAHDRIQSCKDGIAALQDKLDDSTAMIETCSDEYERLTDKIEENHKQLVQLSALTAELRLTEAQLSDLESSIARDMSVFFRYKDLPSQDELVDMREKLRAARKKLKDSTEEALELRTKLLEQIDRINADIADLRDDLTCPTCGTILDNDRVSSIVKAKTSDVHALAVRATSAGEDLVDIKKHDEELSYQQDILSSKIIDAGVRDAAKTSLQSLRDEKYNLNERCIILAGRISEIESSVDEELEEKGKNLEQTISALKSDYNDLLVSIAKLEAEQSHIEDDDKKRIELSKELSLESNVLALLKESKDFANSVVKPVIEQHASNLVDAMTNGRFAQITFDDSYRFEVFDASGVSSPMLSGGEADVVNLAVRIAISYTIMTLGSHRSGVLILDEVFGSLDLSRQASVLQALQELTHNDFKQIIIVSHSREVIVGVDNVIEIAGD